MCKFIPAFIFLFFFTPLLYSQQPGPAFRHFGIEDGLPSSEVYDVIQDSKGYMWFATDKGACRYDGHTFITFALENNMPDNTVFKILEDYKGRIWFVTFSLRLAWYEDGKIHSYPYNKNIEQKVKSKTVYTSFYVDSLDNVYLGIFRLGVLKINKKGKISMLNTIGDQYEMEIACIENKAMIFSIDIDHIKGANNVKFLPGPSFKSEIHMQSPVVKGLIRKNGDLLFVNHFIYCFTNSLKNHVVLKEGNAWSVYEDSEQDIWVGFYKKGIRLYRKDLMDTVPRTMFEGFSVTSICQDHEKGFWFTTLEDGIYYLPSSNMFVFHTGDEKGNEKVNAITLEGKGKILAGFDNGRLYSISKQESYRLQIPVAFNIESIRKMYYDTTENLLMTTQLKVSSGINFFAKTGRTLHKNNSKIGVTIIPNQQIIKSKDGSYWLASSNRTERWRNDSVLFSTSTVREYFRAGTLFEDPEGRMLAGNPEGLWVIGKKEGIRKYDSTLQQLNKRITYITSLPDSTLCLGTRGYGLLLLKGKNIIELTKKSGLASNDISHLFAEKNNLWVSTDKGINCVSFTTGNKNNYTIRHFSVSDGLSSNEVTEVLKVGDYVYAALKKGLAIFNPEEIKINPVPPPVHISTLKIHSHDTTISSTRLELNYEDNTLTIGFVGLSFRDEGKPMYRYKLLNAESDTNWKYTYSNEIQLTALNPGGYLFIVSAMNNSGIWSKQPATLNFTIHPPYWQTWWFRSSLSLALILSSYLIVRNRFKRLSQKNELEKRMIELEANALRAQMNPHFIFNSLNSIQSFIISDKTSQAEIFLADFSRLIRLILDNSRSHYISLFKEIETLNYYLKLEKMRFSGKFNYEIICSLDLDKEKTQLPPMLIQPYIENAILHGVAHLENGGMITIDFSSLNEHHIRCMVDDNGIGRAEAAKNKSQQRVKHISVGTKITEERLMLQQKLSDRQNIREKFSVTIADKINEQGISTGTKVELIIPYKSM